MSIKEDVSQPAPSPQAMQIYNETKAVLSPLVGAVNLLGLLRGILSSGIFAKPNQSQTPEQIAARLRLNIENAANLCRLLDSYGFLVFHDGQYRVADKWSILLASDSIFLLEDTIDLAFAQARALEQLVGGESDYWTMTPYDRLAFAKGITLNPASPHSPAFMAWFIQCIDPELHLNFSNGGRYLELGCGAGGSLLSLLQAYPKLTAVGVDIAADILQETRQRALTLGVSDRVEFRLEDACSFQAQDPFDCVYWSQVFFPTSSRAAAIQVAWNSLRAGGFFILPTFGETALTNDQLRTDAGREDYIYRLLVGAWGVPIAYAQALQDEIEQVGFRNARMVMEIGYMVARRGV